MKLLRVRPRLNYTVSSIMIHCEADICRFNHSDFTPKLFSSKLPVPCSISTYHTTKISTQKSQAELLISFTGACNCVCSLVIYFVLFRSIPVGQVPAGFKSSSPLLVFTVVSCRLHKDMGQATYVGLHLLSSRSSQQSVKYQRDDGHELATCGPRAGKDQQLHDS